MSRALQFLRSHSSLRRSVCLRHGAGRKIEDSSPGGQDHEVRYEAKKFGVKPSAVKKAVGKAGNSRKKVEAQLKG